MANDNKILLIPRHTVQDGDVIVLTAPGGISEKTARMIRKTFKQAFPRNKALVLGDGLQLGVVSLIKKQPIHR